MAPDWSPRRVPSPFDSDLDPRFEEWPLPEDDGWQGLYRLFDHVAPRGSWLRRRVCGYLRPKDLERRGNGTIYTLLGVGWFGRVIPTGGIAVRRLTGARMVPYTLRGPSVGAARDFYFRTCIFELLHLPFLLALLALTLRQIAAGRIDLAVQDTVVNLLFNVYPIMHHRRTRARIANLLGAQAARRASQSEGPETVP